MQRQATVFPSLALPLVTSQRTLSDLLGSGINRVHVTYSQPPAEQPSSRITRSAVLPSLVRFPTRPPQQAHFGIRSVDPMHLLSTLQTPRYRDARKTSLLACLLDFGQAGLSPAS